MRYRFTPNDNGQGLDSRSEAAQDPKLHKRYFAGYTGTAKNLFGKKTLSDFGTPDALMKCEVVKCVCQNRCKSRSPRIATDNKGIQGGNVK